MKCRRRSGEATRIEEEELQRAANPTSSIIHLEINNVAAIFEMKY